MLQHFEKGSSTFYAKASLQVLHHSRLLNSFFPQSVHILKWMDPMKGLWISDEEQNSVKCILLGERSRSIRRSMFYQLSSFRSMALIYGPKLLIYYFIYTALGNFDS